LRVSVCEVCDVGKKLKIVGSISRSIEDPFRTHSFVKFNDIPVIFYFFPVNIPRNERADLERQVRDLVGQSDDASDFERFEPEDAYEVPDFDDWEKVENYRNIVEFNIHCLRLLVI
jgi:hypothetical protein